MPGEADDTYLAGLARGEKRFQCAAFCENAIHMVIANYFVVLKQVNSSTAKRFNDWSSWRAASSSLRPSIFDMRKALDRSPSCRARPNRFSLSPSW